MQRGAGETVGVDRGKRTRGREENREENGQENEQALVAKSEWVLGFGFEMSGCHSNAPDRLAFHGESFISPGHRCLTTLQEKRETGAADYLIFLEKKT